MEMYVDAKTIAQHFGVSRGTVHNWIHGGGCPHRLRGNILRFKLSEVEAWYSSPEKCSARVRRAPRRSSPQTPPAPAPLPSTPPSRPSTPPPAL